MAVVLYPKRRTTVAPAFVVLTALAALISCGGISNGTADAGPSGTSDANGTPDSGPSTPYVGYVATNEYGALNAGFFPLGSVSVALLDALAPAASIADLCGSPATIAGNCCYSSTPSPVSLLSSGVSAGTLTMSDGSDVLDSLAPSTQGQYTNQSTSAPEAPWNPGDLLQIAASGGVVVDAFGGPLQSPGPWNTTPGTAPGTKGGVVVDRSKAFVQTWVPDTHAGETVGLFMTIGLGAPQEINCRAADASGQLAVPAQLLANAPAGAQVITNVYRGANNAITTGSVTVYMDASTQVTWTGTIP